MAKKNTLPNSESFSDLSSQVRFTPDTGHILLFDQRMLLIHGFALGELRRELISRMGIDEARSVFTRLGYQQGIEDCSRIKAMAHGDIETCLTLGPRLREIEGFVRTNPVERMRTENQESFYGDYLWSASWEGEAHLSQHGLSGEPACWLMIGYCNGYCTSLIGTPILWKEVECVAMGHQHCRVIGKPLSEWKEEDRDLRFLRIEDFVDAPSSHTRASSSNKKERSSNLDQSSNQLIGASSGFNAVVQLLNKVAPTDATVLFLGESGVGKEQFSKTLHKIGSRSNGPFVSVNCAAIPHDLVEAELFGVEKGAFTGAIQSRPGRFERADGGTIFLDEIGCLSLPAQGKLLRILQEREVERVGDTKSRPLNVRVVAATNQDLRKDVEDGRFRADLFYRLNVFPVEIPPLRERREDIPLLLNVFLERYCNRFNKKVLGISERAFSALWSYQWPGNVRELENMVERAVIMVDDGGRIDIPHLFSGGEKIDGLHLKVSPFGHLIENRNLNKDAGLSKKVTGLLDLVIGHDLSLAEVEELLVREAISRSDGNVSAAAKILKLGRGQMQYRATQIEKSGRLNKRNQKLD